MEAKNSVARSKSKQYSYHAIEWLESLRFSLGINILHASNGGEVVVEDPELKTHNGKRNKKYYCDGYCEETNTIYEYYGNFVHGALKTAKDKKNKLKLEKNKKTMDREKRLRDLGFNVVSMWNDDWLNSEDRLIFLLSQMSTASS